MEFTHPLAPLVNVEKKKRKDVVEEKEKKKEGATEKKEIHLECHYEGDNKKIYNEEDYYICHCPHCNSIIQIYKKDINCQIFRCGIFKNTHQPINPHLSKTECDKLYEKDLIYGCGKPFKFDGKTIEICEYI